MPSNSSASIGASMMPLASKGVSFCHLPSVSQLESDRSNVFV